MVKYAINTLNTTVFYTLLPCEPQYLAYLKKLQQIHFLKYEHLHISKLSSIHYLIYIFSILRACMHILYLVLKYS